MLYDRGRSVMSLKGYKRYNNKNMEGHSFDMTYITPMTVDINKVEDVIWIIPEMKLATI